MITKKQKLSLFSMLVFLFFASMTPDSTAQAGISEKELSRQEALALEYQVQLSRIGINDAKARESFYLRIAEDCPDTEAAEEALWALSNLYLDDFEEPEEAKAKAILEKFLQKYPASKWNEHVNNRLLWLNS